MLPLRAGGSIPVDRAGAGARAQPGADYGHRVAQIPISTQLRLTVKLPRSTLPKSLNCWLIGAHLFVTPFNLSAVPLTRMLRPGLPLCKWCWLVLFELKGPWMRLEISPAAPSAPFAGKTAERGLAWSPSSTSWVLFGIPSLRMLPAMVAGEEEKLANTNPPAAATFAVNDLRGSAARHLTLHVKLIQQPNSEGGRVSRPPSLLRGKS